MKAREMGKFLSEFLDGFTDSTVPRGSEQPVVVPVDQLKATLLEVLPGLLMQMAGETPVPSQPSSPSEAEQLSMMFRDAGREGEPEDPMAEAIRERVAATQEAAERRARAERNGSGVPEMYDPNDPASTKPWTAPIMRE